MIYASVNRTDGMKREREQRKKRTHLFWIPSLMNLRRTPQHYHIQLSVPYSDRVRMCTSIIFYFGTDLIKIKMKIWNKMRQNW